MTTDYEQALEDRERRGVSGPEEIPNLPEPMWTRNDRHRSVVIESDRWLVEGWTPICADGRWSSPTVEWDVDSCSPADAPAFAEAVKTVARLIAAEYAELVKGKA